MTPKTDYTVDYFIEKFSKIPEGMWITGDFGRGGVHCAGGHCGCTYSKESTDEAMALAHLIGKLPLVRHNGGYSDIIYDNIVCINYGHTQYQQNTPKQRILAALYDIKKLQENKTEIPSTPIHKDITKIISQLPYTEERADVLKVEEKIIQ